MELPGGGVKQGIVGWTAGGDLTIFYGVNLQTGAVGAAVDSTGKRPVDDPERSPIMAGKVENTNLDQIVARQVRLWEIRRLGEREREIEDRIVEEAIQPYITISREAGSGGMIIGRNVASRLSWQFYDRELVEHMARVAHVRQSVVESLDEVTMDGIREWITTLVDRDSFSHDQFLKHLMTVLLTITRHERAVLLGRGANFVLPPERGLRVRLIEPLEMRVLEFGEMYDLEPEEARKQVMSRDRQIQEFVRQHYRRDVTDSTNYDVVLNRAFLSREQCVDQIVAAAQIRLREMF
jgi:cytidylate kinase